MTQKVILIPGNGNSSIKDNWFQVVKKDLEEQGIKVIAQDFPDPDLAREAIWIPFLRDTLKADDQTVLVGHSSGAIAAMRYAEQYKILGSVLIGAYHTDLDMEKEKQSGYFNRPWHFDKIRQNQQFITVFASIDDPWIPIEQPRHLHENLQCEYHEFQNQGHFGGDYDKKTFPELTLSILRNLETLKNQKAST